MRLGGPIFTQVSSAEEWAAAVRQAGYGAAYCPLPPEADDKTCQAYAEAAREADIVVAEVGAWSNPMGPDPDVRRAAFETCVRGLALAERVGARCCVNVAGSRGPKWDGPDARDLSPETFDLLVETVRRIIDAVRPTRTFYTLETMPWMFPDSTESYLRLLAAVDRPAFAVHFDPVNLISSPQRCFGNAGLIQEFVRTLGPRIRSCHAKDILLQPRLTVHLDEVRPGCGALDYRTLLTELNRLDPDLPLLLEHLPSAEEYDLAGAFVRKQARSAGVKLR
jgi:sugar phosphate isomerase/epimerase